MLRPHLQPQAQHRCRPLQILGRPEVTARHGSAKLAICPTFGVGGLWEKTSKYEKDKKLTHLIQNWSSSLPNLGLLFMMGLFVNAMEVFNEARVFGLKLDKFTYAGALNLCAQTGDLLLGQ
ncbi:hypothetical protein CMV_010091 [Castanea mollissima]|uniref:Uncharacterized protein n=1 Tax=Castanea mollissima TaxID=60419 RepID=A0A8J4VY39_9ROSI|nr:hypothetical protein CMV_010091 [Castanea mollissima]